MESTLRLIRRVLKSIIPALEHFTDWRIPPFNEHQFENPDKFGFVFPDVGDYVFESSQNSAMILIVHVAEVGTFCEGYRIQPQSELQDSFQNQFPISDWLAEFAL